MSEKDGAPGELELVREFVNTVDVEEGTEQLGTPAALGSWLTANGLLEASPSVTKADLRHAIQVREALRGVLLAHNGDVEAAGEAFTTLDHAAQRARIRLRFDEQAAAVLEPDAKGVDGALGRLLSIVHASIADGTWLRLKACREHTCQWAFYDHTKNRSGAWCNMAVCGNRAKARAYRERRGAAGATTGNSHSGSR